MRAKERERPQGRGLHAVSCFLPLSLRLRSTSRPPAVLMRLRKPCSMLRCRFLGWNVIFAIYIYLLIRQSKRSIQAGRALCQIRAVCPCITTDCSVYVFQSMLVISFVLLQNKSLFHRIEAQLLFYLRC